MSDHTPATKKPTLTDEERQRRAVRLQAEHDAYIKSIATSRSLPQLRSTIAGAGGKTNAQARVAEERERERMDRIETAARVGAEAVQRRAAREEKVGRFESAQAVKRAKRQRKKEKQKNSKSKKAKKEETGSSSSSSSDSRRDDDKEEDDSDSDSD